MTRVHVYIPEDTLLALDDLRGLISRSAYLTALVEGHLNSGPPLAPTREGGRFIVLAGEREPENPTQPDSPPAPTGPPEPTPVPPMVETPPITTTATPAATGNPFAAGHTHQRGWLMADEVINGVRTRTYACLNYGCNARMVRTG